MSQAEVGPPALVPPEHTPVVYRDCLHHTPALDLPLLTLLLNAAREALEARPVAVAAIA